jgi:hypothetical protein
VTQPNIGCNNNNEHHGESEQEFPDHGRSPNPPAAIGVLDRACPVMVGVASKVTEGFYTNRRAQPCARYADSFHRPARGIFVF